MRRSILLALSVALVALAFVPTAMAQTNYQGGGNQGMNPGGTDNNMMASPPSGASTTAMSGATASAMASAMASPSAAPSTSSSASSSASTSASASVPGATSSAEPSKVLPDTGGVPLVSLLSVGAFVLLVGSGVFAARLAR